MLKPWDPWGGLYVVSSYPSLHVAVVWWWGGLGHKGKGFCTVTPQTVKLDFYTQKTQKLIISGGFQLIFNKNVQLRFLAQFDVVCTRKWSKTTQRPQIRLAWYLWIGNWTTRSENLIDGL